MARVQPAPDSPAEESDGPKQVARLKVVIVDDNDMDAELIGIELRRASLACETTWVNSEASFLRALDEGPDIILSDYSMPGCNALEVLRHVRERNLATPVLIISGSIDEETAVEAMRLGASDYLFKDRLGRLGPAIEHAVEGLRLDRAKREAEAAHAHLAAIIEASPDLIGVTDPAGRPLYLNAAGRRILGLDPKIDIRSLAAAGSQTLWGSEIPATMHGGVWRGEGALRHRSGREIFVMQTILAHQNAAGVLERYSFVTRDISEQKVALEKLRQSEALLHMASRLGRMGAWAVELPEFKITWSEGIRAIHEVAPDYVPTIEQAINFYAPEFRATIRDTVERCVREGTSWDVELQIITARGRRVWVRAIGEAERDAAGAIRRVQGAFQDISDQKAVAEKARQLAEHYRLIFNRNPSPMWLFDLETTRFLAVNVAAIAKYGYSEEEFLTMSILDIRPPEEQARLRGLLHQRAFGLDANRGVWRHKKKNGEIIAVDIAAETISLDGRPARLISVNDITERLRAERQIAQQAALIDQANDAIIVRDLEHVIQFWSKGAERLYGWTAAEVIGRKEAELSNVHPEKFAEAMRRVLQAGDWSGELEQTTKDQRNIIVSARWSLLRQDDGTPRAILAIKSEITEQKKIEAQFLRAQRLDSIGTLAGGIAHDLNNILAPILMGAGLLKGKLADPKDKNTADLIQSAAQRGAGIIRQLLTFSRGIEGARSTVQLRHLINEMMEIMRETFPRNLAIERDVKTNLRFVRADATQLHQVLMNLCVNARDAMPGGGKLSVTAENRHVTEDDARSIPRATPGSYVLLTVADTGHGIPREVIDRIFDPFFTTKALGAGTGLGLSTVLGIVKSHDGFLTVESNPGLGTVFKVYLPAVEAPDAAHPDALPEVPGGNGELILLVDDEASICEVTRSVLEENHYRVFTAGNGREALRLIADHRHAFHVIVTDLMMPIMGGMELIRCVCALHPSAKFIAMTGLEQPTQSRELADFGVSEILPKPCDPTRLLQALHRTLTSGQAARTVPVPPPASA